jgi:hypothetical protein
VEDPDPPSPEVVFRIRELALEGAREKMSLALTPLANCFADAIEETQEVFPFFDDAWAYGESPPEGGRSAAGTTMGRSHNWRWIVMLLMLLL